MSEAAWSATISVATLLGLAMLFVGWIHLWVSFRDKIGGWMAWLGASLPLLIFLWLFFYHSF